MRRCHRICVSYTMLFVGQTLFDGIGNSGTFPYRVCLLRSDKKKITLKKSNTENHPFPNRTNIETFTERSQNNDAHYHP